MKKKQTAVIIFSILVFFAASLGKPVFAERANPELEFLIDNARKEINKQEAIVQTLRRRYEDILKRKKALQQFIDEENKKIEELKLLRSKAVVKSIKSAPVFQKRQGIQVPKKASEESRVLREEKKIRKQKQEIARRNAVQDEILRQQEKEKQQQAELEKKKQGQIKFLAGQKAKEQKTQEEILNKKRQTALVKKQEKERELLSKKLEKERLLAGEKEQRQMRERECQMRLLLEADKNAKHERYVSQLGQLLNRQNSLLEESRKLEFQIRVEEENLKVLERTREELIRKILENS
ncbi:MAG: hypothetical protein NTY14_07160 [Candidatus Omnitrophica bacterium]|nr:hypothetical protein [Candidatus Omnitrophota bacterium]